MYAETSYEISINGNESETQALGEILKAKITDVDFEVSNQIRISSTCDCIYEDDIVSLAKEMAQAAENASFQMVGTIDTYTASESKNFGIEFKNGKLSASFSDWYVAYAKDFFDDYEDFYDCFSQHSIEISEAEYEILKNKDFLYRIEGLGDKKDVLLDHVPLKDGVDIAY